MPTLPLGLKSGEPLPLIVVNRDIQVRIGGVQPFGMGLAVHLSFANLAQIRSLLFQIMALNGDEERLVYQEVLDRKDLLSLVRQGDLSVVSESEAVVCPLGVFCRQSGPPEYGEELPCEDNLEVRVIASGLENAFCASRSLERTLSEPVTTDSEPRSEDRHRLHHLSFRRWLVLGGDPLRVREALQVAAREGAPFTRALTHLCRPVNEDLRRQ